MGDWFVCFGLVMYLKNHQHFSTWHATVTVDTFSVGSRGSYLLDASSRSASVGHKLFKGFY